MPIEGGVIHCVNANAPMRVIILDQDTENGDEERIHEVLGADHYVTDALLEMSPNAEKDSDGVSPEFVRKVVEALK